MVEDKALVKKGVEHEKLVTELKKALMFVQLSFFQAAKFLYEIHSKKTYLSEDSSRKISFTEFCQRPDIPLPGRNEAGRLRTAQKLIRVYKFYIIDKGYKEEKLAPVGYSKLNMLVPVIEAREAEADEWLEKASLLTSRDLITEIKLKDKTLGEILECPHNNTEKVTFFRCLDCRNIYKKDPHSKNA